ncbi:MAG: class I SAM-dependent methyltransferase [Planctomycetes bacterium]|nr:class I SAM-dependent methyltransferase [Planctomycetota bacterium]MCB9910136.1 class I SAM-dependent methyltransferase [Planctomycetota bacterium]MCB9913097.1 class I SAM-dependent methyltransferase [Planctomycetota bacterium]HPF14560.1 class I SAM-dependent methyltransferase [Planctomycetota bacterium]
MANSKASTRKASESSASGVQELDWYRTPHYYDIIFDEDTEREADFLEDARERYALSRGRRVLEPACGSGRLVKAMAERGYRVTGTDRSPEMLAYADERVRAAGLKARLVQANMQDPAPKGPYDLAHCLVSTFKYLLRETDARAHLQSVADALAPGGIYCLGFHLSKYDGSLSDEESWKQTRAGVQVECSIDSSAPNRKARTEEVTCRLRVREGRRRLETVTHWKFRTYNAAQFRSLLAKVPELELVATHDFLYEIEECMPFDDALFDALLILRKRR